jgi:hypothetical protein
MAAFCTSRPPSLPSNSTIKIGQDQDGKQCGRCWVGGSKASALVPGNDAWWGRRASGLRGFQSPNLFGVRLAARFEAERYRRLIFRECGKATIAARCTIETRTPALKESLQSLATFSVSDRRRSGGGAHGKRRWEAPVFRPGSGHG